MTLIVSPSGSVNGAVGIPICFEATATSNFPSQDLACIDLASSGLNWVYSSCVWQKIGGEVDTGDAPAYSPTLIQAGQPFTISADINSFDTPASPNRNYATYLGVVGNGIDCGDFLCFYGFIINKYCGSSSPSACNFFNGTFLFDRWYFCTARDGGIIAQVLGQSFPNDGYKVTSDGTLLRYYHRQGTTWILQNEFPIPVGITTFQFYLNARFDQNKLYNIQTSYGSFQGNIPITWTAPLGGTLSGSGNNQCFTHGTAGTFQICADTEFDDPICVDIVLSVLYFRPTDRDCNDCAYASEVLTFESNGAPNGTLTATHGTVIDNLTWQAPDEAVPDGVTLTYTVGTIVINCVIYVIAPLVVTNVSGSTLTGLIPGDLFQLTVNDPYEVEWENLDCQNLVSPDGIIYIPPTGIPGCFSSTDCYIRARVVNLESVCPNYASGVFTDIRIIVDPVYPTPAFGGPSYNKWKPEVPEYRVIVNTNEGGCDETYLRNRVATYKWTVNYSGLTYEEPCAPEVCCDDDRGFLGGFSPQFQTAKVLDDFWNFVYGTYGRFTLIEPRTGVVWRNVRFETNMQRDHVNWFRTQSRTLTLIWVPCCDVEPLGGVCPHTSSVIDNIPPSAPQNILVQTQTAHWIQVTWLRATDNVGIKGYEIWVDGDIIDIGHHLVYNHKGLASLSTHTYKVRAYDFAGNRSEWSAPELGTTFENVIEGVVDVYDGGDEVLEG